MLGQVNGSMLLTQGFIGSTQAIIPTPTSAPGNQTTWFTNPTAFLTEGFVYNAGNTIWLSLDLNLVQSVTWTVVY